MPREFRLVAFPSMPRSSAGNHAVRHSHDWVGQGVLYPRSAQGADNSRAAAHALARAVQDAIDELNRLSGSLNCDRLFIYSIRRAMSIRSTRQR